MKKSILLSLLAIIALGLGACSNSSNNKQANGQENSAQKKASQSSSKTKDIATLLEEIETANQKMTSVRQKGDISGSLKTKDGTIQKNQEMTSQVIYKTEKQEVEMASITVKTVENGEENFKELLMPGGKNTPLYTRYNKTGEWDKELYGEGGKYIVNPDYFQLLNGLNELTEDLALEETDDAYVLTLKNKGADVIGIYEKEFQFNLSQFPKSKYNNELTVKIDKKSKFLKEFKMAVSTSGNKGTLTIKSEISYSDWNLVKKEDIPTISDEKKEQ
jgi:hypothetical protein